MFAVASAKAAGTGANVVVGGAAAVVGTANHVLACGAIEAQVKGAWVHNITTAPRPTRPTGTCPVLRARATARSAIFARIRSRWSCAGIVFELAALSHPPLWAAARVAKAKLAGIGAVTAIFAGSHHIAGTTGSLSWTHRLGRERCLRRCTACFVACAAARAVWTLAHKAKAKLGRGTGGAHFARIERATGLGRAFGARKERRRWPHWRVGARLGWNVERGRSGGGGRLCGSCCSR